MICFMIIMFHDDLLRISYGIIIMHINDTCIHIYYNNPNIVRYIHDAIWAFSLAIICTGNHFFCK